MLLISHLRLKKIILWLQISFPLERFHYSIRSRSFQPSYFNCVETKHGSTFKSILTSSRRCFVSAWCGSSPSDGLHLCLRHRLPLLRRGWDGGCRPADDLITEMKDRGTIKDKRRNTIKGRIAASPSELLLKSDGIWRNAQRSGQSRWRGSSGTRPPKQPPGGHFHEFCLTKFDGCFQSSI